ncbi:hypothetical protein BDR04DRAFT_233715 [Suillus decipiens]|nr:hypothetical protein BDR04DRAFT_233715 [Suillus decipiens]
MNGLRYHYQHSGDHGAIGLALLASGQHECLQNAHGRSSSASSRHSTPATSGHSTPQYLRQQQQALHAQMQMGYPTCLTEAIPITVAQP